MNLFKIYTMFIHLVVLVVGREQGFVYCPAYPCLCEPRNGELVINCKYLYLTELPKFLSFDGRVRELSLRKNSIRSLPSGSFQGLHIEVIDLTENIVTKIHEKAFIGLEDSLEELHIQVYAMQDLPIKALENLKKLRVLRIIGCRVPTIKSDTFSGLKHLIELHLVSCRISHIEPGGISSLKNLQILNMAGNQLRYQHLREIAKLIELRKLVLSQNQVQVLGTQVFGDLLHLQHIDMQGNQIQSIDKNAFKNLEFSLEFLDLSKNTLQDNALISLRSLQNLRELILNDNKMTNLPSNGLEKLELIAKLELERNKITRLSKQSLKGTEKFLQVLKLSGNPLKFIENETFSDHTSLRQLYLDDTNLGGNINKVCFHGLENSLNILSMTNSNLGTGDLPAFQELQTLKSLTLADNKIRTIPKDAFLNARRLRQVDLSMNKISEIEHEAFRGLEISLQSIDLSSNLISTMSRCIFERFPHLNGMRLGNNPLQCDCRLTWLYNWLKLHHPDFSRSMLDWICAGPAHIKQKPFRLLHMSDFGCTNETENETCEWTVDPLANPLNPTDLEVVPSPLLPVDMLGTKILVRLKITPKNVLIVSWNCTSRHEVAGYRVMLRKLNNTMEERDITVTSDVNHQLFANIKVDTEYEVCVLALSTTVLPMGRDCRTIFNKAHNNTALDQSKPFERSSFITLLWAYTLGSLAATGVFVMVAICVLKRRKQLQKAKPFSPGYPAWAGMLYGRPENSSQGPPSCYFSSHSTGMDELDVTGECYNNHGRCSTVSTFRRHLPANYIVTSADLNDDFYFHF